MAAANYKALFGVQSRPIHAEGSEDGMAFTLQHNPARVRSTGAKVDAASVASRPCFLCASNRSAEQMSLTPAELSAGLAGMPYEILLNPFPIFPYHFTIPSLHHEPQSIASADGSRFDDMLRLAEGMEGMALFYNGARCGASAPDHFHFQAVPGSAMPILSTDRELPFVTYGYESSSREEMCEWFRRVTAMMADLPVCPDASADEVEPRMNVICMYSDGLWKAVVIPRRAHRPDFYGEGEGRYLLSPASVDLAGTIVVPSSADYAAITPSVIASLLRQTTYPPVC